MKSKNFRAAFIITFSILLTTLTFYFYQVFNTPNIVCDQKDAYLFIPKGATIETVTDSLKAKGFLNDELSFRFTAKMMGYHKKVKPGRYLLKANSSNREVIRLLRSGKQTPVRLTFNNIRLKKDFAQRVGSAFEFGPDRLYALLNDPNLAGQYGFDTTTIMCMFIPNTYEIYWDITPERFMARMADEYQEFWTKERSEKLKSIGLNKIQAAVLASIVQAETNKKEEKPRVAGVYLNRLKKEILLQADPTLVFAWGDFNIKRVLNKHMSIESPYNTYRNKGLPPGPINLPSPESIDAVLNYENHDYLFFCARGDGSGMHNFARNMGEHEANAKLYHQVLNRRGIR